MICIYFLATHKEKIVGDLINRFSLAKYTWEMYMTIERIGVFAELAVGFKYFSQNYYETLCEYVNCEIFYWFEKVRSSSEEVWFTWLNLK